MQEQEPILQFPVMSDIHIGGQYQQERFKTALEDFRMIAPNYQAVVMIGDLTDFGAEEEYDVLSRLLDSYMNPGAEKVMTIGNHEYREGEKTPTETTAKFYRDRFLNKTGMPGVNSQIYYDKWINNYHFIALGSEGYTGLNNNDKAKISDEQYHWLEQALAEESDPMKPIFVFLHQGIDSTVYGTELWGAGFTDTRLIDLLKQYPQVIFFSGHSHYILNHPRTIYQDGFTMVNTGSVLYGYTDLGSTSHSQGLLVNVYPDKVEIKAREFTNHTWIQSFTVQTPFVQTYKDGQKPAYKRGAAAQLIQNDKGDSVTLSWDAASDNLLVDKYFIKHNDKVIHTVYTKYWENQQQDIVTAEIKNLYPDTEYTFEIVAVDAWNNESFNSLEIMIKTSVTDGWHRIDNKWYFYEYGKKVAGWKFIEGYWYYFLPDGIMHIGWKEIDGHQYFFGSNGAMKTGWIFYGSKWYYLNYDGTLKLGWLRDQGVWYYLKFDGMVTGWGKINNTWYYFNGSGAMQTGWVLSSGKWYYLDAYGAMKVGWMQFAGKWYYLEASGAMKTGWLSEGSTWYYLKSDGSMQTGWAKINGVWYYFLSNGALR